MDRRRRWFVNRVWLRLGARTRVLVLVLAIPLGVMIALLGYFLSTGPLIYAEENWGLTSYPFVGSFLEVVYFPIVWCEQNSKAFDHWLEWYL
ncbi:MAG: hypothetical protein B7Z55_11305, partial [Planctomycetales bacterium 12-60-4]